MKNSRTLLRYLALALATTVPAYAAGDKITTFLQNLVSVATGTWAIAFVVLGTVFCGVRYLMSDDRSDHGKLVHLMIGGILVLGAQVFVTGFVN